MTSTRIDRRSLLKLTGGATALAAGVAPKALSAAPTQLPRPAARSAQDKPTLTLMTWGGPETAQKRDAGLRTVYPDLPSVEFLVGGEGDFGVANALRLALVSGEDIPDMLQLNRTQVAEFAAADELLDLNEVYAPIQDDLYAGAIELTKYEDTFVSFPFELKCKLFFYRSDLFQEAGVDPAALTSFQSFLDAGNALTAAVPSAKILNLGPEPAQYWMGEILSAYENPRFADDDGNYQITANPAFAGVFTFLKGIQDAGIALPIDDWSTDWQASWAQSAIAGSLLANWLKFFLPTFAPDQAGKWAVGLWPTLDPYADQRYGSEAGGSVYVVPKRAKHADAAVDYLTKMFLDTAGAMTTYTSTGNTPLRKSSRDEFLAAVGAAQKPADMSDADWAIQPTNFFGAAYYEAELASYDYVRIIPYDPSASEEVPILRDWLIKYLAGDADLDEALGSAQDDMESQIGNPYDV